MSVSGCVFAQTNEFPDSILVEILDMQGNSVPDRPPLDINAGVVFHNMNPILVPGLPAMYYAFPKAPKDPGTYQVRVSITYPSGVISPRMKTFQVFNNAPGQVTQRGADLPGNAFRLQFERPASNARLSPIRPIPISCTTKITRRSAYGYFLLIDDTTDLIAATAFHKTWLMRPRDCQMSTSLTPPRSADGPFSIVAYILQMNQGAIQESRSQAIRMQATGGQASLKAARVAAPALVGHVPDPRLDLNTASERDLIAIPGIGRTIAKRIVEARPFTSVEKLTEVQNFPEAKLDEVANFVTIFDS